MSPQKTNLSLDEIINYFRDLRKEGGRFIMSPEVQKKAPGHGGYDIIREENSDGVYRWKVGIPVA